MVSPVHPQRRRRAPRRHARAWERTSSRLARPRSASRRHARAPLAKERRLSSFARPSGPGLTTSPLSPFGRTPPVRAGLLACSPPPPPTAEETLRAFVAGARTHTSMFSDKARDAYIFFRPPFFLHICDASMRRSPSDQKEKKTHCVGRRPAWHTGMRVCMDRTPTLTLSG